tara:strand:+ start:190 stop:570 length:381 start_codon:yes stop_codon:yes gene_type:complete
MALYEKVKLYLEANSRAWDDNTVALQNDGDGDYIKTWNIEGLNKPTDAELDAYEDTANFNIAINDLRIERNKDLQESDWTVLQDNPLTPEKRSEWMVFRTALRNITNDLTTAEDVNSVDYPDKPNG